MRKRQGILVTLISYSDFNSSSFIKGAKNLFAFTISNLYRIPIPFSFNTIVAFRIHNHLDCCIGVLTIPIKINCWCTIECFRAPLYVRYAIVATTIWLKLSVGTKAYNTDKQR